MATDIEICSNALMLLGDKPIASFDEGGAPAALTRARLCGALYPQVKRAILRRHPWNCAVKRVQLSPDSEAPAFGYTYRFLKPGDWLRTLEIGDGGRLVNRPDFRDESGYLLSDERFCPLVYIADVPAATFDALLTDVMTMAMAFRLAYPITKSSTVEDAKLKELQGFMREARAVDGQDEPPDTFGDLRLIGARLGGSSLGG